MKKLPADERLKNNALILIFLLREATIPKLKRLHGNVTVLEGGRG